jgi:hypothetical protein
LLTEFWTWLESQPLSLYIGESAWFPFLESIHVVTATFLVGSILMVDLRLLGLAARRYSVRRVVREVVPWTYAASLFSVATGVGLFITRAGHYAGNRAFQIKMVLLVFAGLNMVVFHLITAGGIERSDEAGAITTASRVAGACSLLLWIGILLAGRWIGHLSS